MRAGGLRLGFGEEFAVGESDDAIGEARGERTFVRYHQNGHAQILIEGLQEEHDFFAGDAVEISGGLVGEKNRRAIDERAGHGSALLLSAGKFRRPMAEALRKPYAFEGFADAREAFRARDFGETQGQLDIFFESHTREQIERLKHHADHAAAVARELMRIHFGEVAALDVDCTAGGTVEAGEQIQESGFS